MKLWMLRYEEASYDCAEGFVIAAKDELEARGLAAQSCGVEGPNVWLVGGSASCVELKPRNFKTSDVLLEAVING